MKKSVLNAASLKKQWSFIPGIEEATVRDWETGLKTAVGIAESHFKKTGKAYDIGKISETAKNCVVGYLKRRGVAVGALARAILDEGKKEEEVFVKHFAPDGNHTTCGSADGHVTNNRDECTCLACLRACAEKQASYAVELNSELSAENTRLRIECGKAKLRADRAQACARFLALALDNALNM